MKNTVSVKKNKDFRLIYKRGKSSVSPVLALYARKNKKPSNRIGITVSTKVGKAVVRNRVRRRIREAYRINEKSFLPGYDIIIVSRVRAAKASFREIEKNLLELSARLGLLSEEQE
ncbi:MAG: ribonuclease P protein component [Oscillospiraceae bacterium]|nr:ribonuclease P protein component [Oscillospiraceae bacterium]MBQ4544043.1 ribonuclease P protein component [Oscillospiraceae bacterium]MBQ6901699.1 ribonuclease P protein component [Oscillospiraceae bacterium]